MNSLDHPDCPRFDRDPDDTQPTTLTRLLGRRIVGAELGQWQGYDTLFLVLDDGSTMTIQEQGQAGSFTVDIKPDTP